MKRPADEAVDNSGPCHSNGVQATLASHGSGDGVMANDAMQSAIGPPGGILLPVISRNDPYANHTRYQQGGGRRKDGCPNRALRCVTVGLSDDGVQLSPISWLDPPGDLCDRSSATFD